MKLYLSSIEVPAPGELEALLGKSFSRSAVAVIPNAQDYYSERARKYKNDQFEAVMKALGMKVETVDLREFDDVKSIEHKLSAYDLVWARGGNTYCLRYEMRRSGFDKVIGDLLKGGIVYGGDSAGALVAGSSIKGIESADIPEFAEKVIEEGLKLIPYTILPHVDNPEFTEAAQTVRGIAGETLIELKDSQAVIFEGNTHTVVESPKF